MRWIQLLVAGLLVAGSVPCHVAGAQPGDAAPGAHATVPGSHAAPGHAHDGDRSEPDACDWVGVVKTSSEAVTAPPSVTPAEAPPLPGTLLPPRLPEPTAPAVLVGRPVTPVHRHVVLRI